jgi:xylulokinase
MAMGDVQENDIDGWNPIAGEVTPDPGAAAVYARQLAVFKELYPRTRDLMRRLARA